MKVLYDHQAFMWPGYSGIPRYFSELITEFRKNREIEPIVPNGYCQNQDYRMLIFPENSSIPLSWRARDILLSASRKLVHKDPAAYFTSVEKKCRKMLGNEEYDVFHPTHFSTYYRSQKITAPVVVTVHDFTFEKYSELYPLSKSAKVIRDTEASLKSATRIICISEYTKKELFSFYDLDSDIVDVIYLGPPLQYRLQNKTPDTCETIPYLLYVGVRNGHKNFFTLVHALCPLLQETKIKLICAGSPFTKDEVQYLDSLGLNKFISTICADNQKLLSLYQNAIAFIFPSINEGFGLPVLEAFSCGCPVICSNTSSFPEIGGGAAEYFNPKDIGSMREAIWKVVSDEKLRKRMIDAGYKQLEKFTWRKCAEETKQVYERAIGVN